MNAETEEVGLTNSTSKFEALLYQFVKLYDRLTLEHSLMNDRELKLIKNLEGFTDLMMELNNIITKTNNVAVEINKLDKKLSHVVRETIIVKINETCEVLNKTSSKVAAIIKETNQDVFNQAWERLSELIKETTRREVDKNLKFYHTSFYEMTNTFREMAKEYEQLFDKYGFTAMGVCLLVGVILGAVLIRCIF